VLLGLLREGQGVACQALVVLGVDLGGLQEAAEAVANESVAGGARAPAPDLGLDDVRAILGAVEAAFGAHVRLGGLRLLRAGVAEVAVRAPDGAVQEIATVVDRGGRWEVD